MVTAAFGMPKAQTGMAEGKFRSNICDDDLVTRHDVNSAINSDSMLTSCRVETIVV